MTTEHIAARSMMEVARALTSPRRLGLDEAWPVLREPRRGYPAFPVHMGRRVGPGLTAIASSKHRPGVPPRADPIHQEVSITRVKASPCG